MEGNTTMGKAQPSPTSGKFLFSCSNNKSSILLSEADDRIEDTFIQGANASSFEFKSNMESSSSFFPGSVNKVNPAANNQRSLPKIEVFVQSENPLQSVSVGPADVHSQGRHVLHPKTDFTRSSTGKALSPFLTDASIVSRIYTLFGQNTTAVAAYSSRLQQPSCSIGCTSACDLPNVVDGISIQQEQHNQHAEVVELPKVSRSIWAWLPRALHQLLSSSHSTLSSLLLSVPPILHLEVPVS